MKTMIYFLWFVLFCMLATGCSNQTVLSGSKKSHHRYTQFDSKRANRNMVHNTKLSAHGIPVKINQ